MDIKDVKVGDRVWVAYRRIPIDENGQNATVIEIDAEDGTVAVANIGWFVPGTTMFWRKPEAPPKPKRKVTHTEHGGIIAGATEFRRDGILAYRDLTLRVYEVGGCRMGLPATLSWEVEE